MAHLEKYKASSVGHMPHTTAVTRPAWGGENIDPARVGMDSEDELSRSLMASEERLDALRWQLRTSPESSGRGARG